MWKYWGWINNDFMFRGIAGDLCSAWKYWSWINNDFLFRGIVGDL